ncbi:hypothetical protein Pelo_18593 [Pelomyxa schiedti]|nr:hypothetical protein Pelo_18593 [Pelomyxa schiedti]
MRRAGRGPRSRRRLTSAQIGADAPSSAALSTRGDTVSASNVGCEPAAETSPSITLTNSSMMLREYPADVLSRTIELVNNPQSTSGYVIILFGAPGSGKRTVIDFIHKKSNRLCCSLSRTFANGVAVIQEEDFEQWTLFILGKIILAKFSTSKDVEAFLIRKLDKHPNGCDVFMCFKIISGPDTFSSTREDILSSSEEIPNVQNLGATTAPIQSPDTDSFVSSLADLVIALGYGPESRFVASLETLIPSDKELFSLVQPISEANSAMDIYRSMVHHVSGCQIKRIADQVEGLTNEDLEKLRNLPCDDVRVAEHLQDVVEATAAHYWIDWLSKNCHP